MPTAAKKAAPKPRTRAAVLAVETPEREVPETIEFPLCGQTYTAHMPKDYIWLEIGAAWAPGATAVTKARAISLFMRACLSPADRDRIEERMLTAASIDPLRGMELLQAIDKLTETWRPMIEAEFGTANLRTAAAA